MNNVPKITAVIADIHGNFEALTAVMTDIEKRKNIDLIVCLGDIIGYGPDPGACLNLIREKANLILAGNHDLAIGSPDTLSQLNSDAQSLIRWTAGRLDREERSFLFTLPLEIKTGPFHFVHGSPDHPSHFNYILTTAAAKKAFLNSKEPFIFVVIHISMSSSFRIWLAWTDFSLTISFMFTFPRQQKWAAVNP